MVEQRSPKPLDESSSLSAHAKFKLIDMAELEIEIKSELSHIEINAVVETLVNGKTTVIRRWLNNITIEDFQRALEILNEKGFKQND